MKAIAKNRKASFEYHLKDRFEAGICLEGWEVKSLREGKINVTESYVFEKGGEMFVSNLRIEPLSMASTHVKADPLRIKKLLLNKKEIAKIVGDINKQGMTCVLTSVYWSNGKVKVEFALAKGKNNYDKRESLKKKSQDMEQKRNLKVR
ncbi:SsrA-binding protein SmpB [Vibrio antiquarius]|uniref:SsrA-binding protein n=1 Tax=Vibrio parahaemolyticus TaxID=670 RepID=A0AA46Z639_VIBPH|nr:MULTISPECIES: SsrA-binding protein SmpB [Vibrio harveyi group]KOE76751.1 SsrA-binding protein [Vibrio parahaemolyticus]MCS0313620.1 SsrA-binding protein SmpB [Vibrio diabolicus]UYV30293.1 SsrA-binding protein SmpB [Vibrio parahaemolyticus]UYW19698.1 SsrA-binding protein SmpB [Vibrio parahaemolyticus]